MFSCFALPVLIGDQIVTVLDIKSDKQQQNILVQKWTWIAPQNAMLREATKAELDQFSSAFSWL
ncbi:hypothetical protein AR456_00605 [Halomonas huangheensis]|nr:hypothetical protein AR456_00605 [Halomonas huangheensis]